MGGVVCLNVKCVQIIGRSNCQRSRLVKKTIHFTVGKVVDGTLYFSCDEYCGLFKFDIVKQKVTFLSFFSEEDILQKFLHSKVLSFGEYLFFIPGGGGKSIHIYNYVTGFMKCVPLFKERGWGGEAFISEGYLWMIPFAVQKHPALRMNLKTMEVESLQDLFSKLSDEYLGDEWGRLLKRIVVDRGSVWFAILHSNEIVQISLCDCKIKKYQVAVKDLFGIFIACNDMWITSYTDENIYKWSPENGIYEKCKVQGTKENTMPSGNVLGIGKDIYALPYLSEYITKYNEKTHCFEKAVGYPMDFCFTNINYTKFWNYDYFQDSIVCFPINAKNILFINTKENKTSTLRTNIDKDILCEPYLSIRREIFKDNFVIESVDIILKDYIQFIGIGESKRKLLKMDRVGKKIYQFLSD